MEASAQAKQTPKEVERDAIDDENRLDFELLMRRRQLSAESRSTLQTTPAELTTNPNEVWPLYLTTYFVDHYILGDVVGNGAYAEVRECVDSRDLTRCAVKIVNKNYLKRQAPRALSNQKQEIKLLRKLKHENIISLRETLYRGPKIYIFLEYCSFVLSDLLQEQDYNRLPIPISRNLFKQLLTGLEYLHSQNIVHRDIKPQNLLITTSGKLKIIDFGVSQCLSIWSWPSDLCENYEGSPLFQAPEVVSGQSEYAGFKVDTWSAGVSLYLILYGQYPFFDTALLPLYDKILTEPFTIPNIDNKNELVNDCLLQQQKVILTDLLASMLEKEAAKRCSIAEALEHSWLKLREDQNVESNKCQDNGFLYSDEHSEFIELLNHWNKQPAKSSSSFPAVSSKSQSDDDDCDPSANGPFNRFNGEEESKKQRDIYLSMSVLPYLYSHHFSHIPVVKATNRRRNSSSSSSSNSLATTTCSSSSTSTCKTSNSSQENSDPSPSTSPSTANKDEDDNAKSITSPSNSPNPHEMIADKAIEWGTRDQYNLLKLPLIRVNRLRSTKRSGADGLGRRRCRRRRRTRQIFRGEGE